MKHARPIPAIALLLALLSCGGVDPFPYDGPLDPVAILSFSASAETVHVGESSVLSWATRDALAVRLVDDTGAVLGDDDLGVGTGTFEVSPVRSTRYTLSAFGASGAQRLTDVEVVVSVTKPSATLTAKAARIELGGSTKLEWTAKDATSVRLLEGDETLLDDAGLAGTLDVSPENTTRYTLIATGVDGVQAKSPVTVEVTPVVVSFRASPAGPQLPGTKVNLLWKTRGADSVTVRGKELSYDAPADRIASGAWEVEAGIGPVVLTAVRDGVETTKELTLPLLVAPVIDRFEVTPTEVSAGPDAPAQVHVVWKVTGADSIALRRGDWETPLDLEAQGELSLPLTESATFTLIASNPAGETKLEAEVRVIPLASIDSFEASTEETVSGEPFWISWTTRDAIFVELWKGDALVSEDDVGADGRMEFTVEATTNFRLIAINRAGVETERSLAVTVRPVEEPPTD